jgi:hypothetical protein
MDAIVGGADEWARDVVVPTASVVTAAPPPKEPNRPSITIYTTEQIVGHLQRLVSTGLYGKSIHDAAERIIARYLEGMIAKAGVQK